MLLPPDQGGFKEAWDENGNVRISDTALHALLPKQAWRMTARHKQMCGCEVVSKSTASNSPLMLGGIKN
jgi:hypothetical protein